MGEQQTWTVGKQLGERSRSNGTDASGWLWELQRNGERREVLVEVAETARAMQRGLPDATLKAIETEGRSEVEKVLGVENPPSVISCGTAGVARDGSLLRPDAPTCPKCGQSLVEMNHNVYRGEGSRRRYVGSYRGLGCGNMECNWAPPPPSSFR